MVVVSSCNAHYARDLTAGFLPITKLQSFNVRHFSFIIRSLIIAVIVCLAPHFLLVLAYWAFTRYDRRTDRSVRLVCPTDQSDDRIL